MRVRPVQAIWLIKRRPRPEHHLAPYHPVILCDLKKIFEWERGSTSEQAFCWVRQNNPSQGWLWLRWNGLDIDYGHVVHGVPLPGGGEVAFVHNRGAEPWTLLKNTVWWSDSKIPKWLLELGVVYPPDGFSQLQILDDIAHFYEDDGISGGGGYDSWPEYRKRPPFWPSLEESLAASKALSLPRQEQEAQPCER